MKTKKIIAKFVPLVVCITMNTIKIEAAAGPNYHGVSKALTSNNYDLAVQITHQIEEKYGLRGLQELQTRLTDNPEIYYSQPEVNFLSWLMGKIEQKKMAIAKQKRHKTVERSLKEPEKKHQMTEEEYLRHILAPAPHEQGQEQPIPESSTSTAQPSSTTPEALELSQFGIMTRTVPALKEAIAHAIAEDWLDRAPGAEVTALIAYYTTPVGNNTFGLNILHEAHKELQQLRSQFIFLANTTDATMTIRIGIDPARENALPPALLSETFGRAPVALFSGRKNFPANGMIHLPWDTRFGVISYMAVSPLVETRGGQFAGRYGIGRFVPEPVQVRPGDIVYLDKLCNIVCLLAL